jgi:hypothetical protein
MGPATKLDECIGLWMLKKSVLVLGCLRLNSVVELVGDHPSSMKWREPVTSLVG